LVDQSLKTQYVRILNDVVHPLYGFGRVDPRDETLLLHGGGWLRSYDIYENIARDPHAYAVLQKRYMAVIGREWEVVPASDRAIDKKAADMVRYHLENLAHNFEEEDDEASISLAGGFDQTCLELLKASLYGFSVGETIWAQDGKEVYPLEIQDCDIRRFTFTPGDRSYKLRLLTPGNSFTGEALPAKKFIVHRFTSGGLAADPYGFGLGSRLFFPNFFKRNAVKFWLIFADKWASPTAVGKHPRNATTEEKDNLMQMLRAIASDSGIIIPENVMVEFLEAQRSGTTNTYQELVEFCNREMSKTVLGETGSTDQQGSGGSRARDQVGNEVRIEIAKGDADLLSETLNRTLVRWICRFNLPDATPPKVWRKFPELSEKEDLGARATRDNTIVSLSGRSLTEKYLVDTYSVEFEPPEATQSNPDDAPDIRSLLEDAAADADFSEPLDYRDVGKATRKKRVCTKGYSCGATCISRSKNCVSELNAQAKAYSEFLARRVAELEAQLTQMTAIAPSTPQPGTVAEVNSADILADPKRFQYKVLGEHTKTGEVGSLAGVKRYDPNLAGTIQVWVDPADGKTYVVNGHNRLALANRLGAETVTVRYLDVKDAAEARAVGALTNIAEGRGTGVDAAKFFKDTGLSREDIEAKGIPMREKIAQDGIALSKLEDALFRRVIDGALPVERAAIIGDSGLDHQQQRSLVNLIEQQSKKRRNITNEVVRELADSVRSATQRTETQFDLFGATQLVQDNAMERAVLTASVRQRLSREKKLFGTVGKSKAAADLERAGNVIDVLSSQKLSREAALTLGIFDQLKHLSGPVNTALNRAADRMLAGESAKRVQDDLYQEITTELPKLVGGGR
jgi:phage gp29-like protein